MKPEIEAKFLLSHTTVEDFRTLLTEKGAHCVAPMRLMVRSLFGKEANASMQHIDYIRVRDEGNSITLSAKKHTSNDGNILDNKELVVTVSDYNTAIAILEEGGLVRTDIQETKRESWKLGEVEIEINLWPNLDPHVEIEAPTTEALRETADILGLDWENKYITSVAELYMEQHHATWNEVQAALRHCSFEHPPFL